MFRTIEDRLQMLERTVERQAFQIELLQSMTGQDNTLYQLILSSNMDRACFFALRNMTATYENKVNDGHPVALHDFITSFEFILRQHNVKLQSTALADLIPTWLRGSNGINGFSPLLHNHFYS